MLRNDTMIVRLYLGRYLSTMEVEVATSEIATFAKTEATEVVAT